MSNSVLPSPVLTRFYHRFVDDGKIADFIQATARCYTEATLQRLAEQGGRESRRAAVLALTLLGGADSARVVADRLRDRDRGVRLLAEEGIDGLWLRGGAVEQWQELEAAARLVEVGQPLAALARIDAILVDEPHYGQAWYQRGRSGMGVGAWETAVLDFERALDCEPRHFRAANQMAVCHTELGQLIAAIGSLEWSLRIHPYQDEIRVRLRRLRRLQGKHTDR